MYNEYIVLKGYALEGYSLGNDTYARRFKGKDFIAPNIFSVVLRRKDMAEKLRLETLKCPCF